MTQQTDVTRSRAVHSKGLQTFDDPQQPESRDDSERGTDDPNSEFLRDVMAGLSATPKTLPPKYFYDEVGCGLFEAITGLDEYYLTRVETSILARHQAELQQTFRQVTTLIELGGISTGRTELMLKYLPKLTQYVPIDIADEPLIQAARLAGDQRPEISVLPVRADFTNGVDLRVAEGVQNVLVFFPGSSVGNLEPDDAVRFLRSIGQALPSAELLIGVDRRKSPQILKAAYDDPGGVTALFNLNLLMRINFDLGADFDAAQFYHEARYDEERGRVEMHLVSRIDQSVCIGDDTFEFMAGESIHTESSYKYDVNEFAALARAAGWDWRRYWSDESGYYAVHHCRMSGGPLDRS